MHQWCQQSTENRIGQQFLLWSILKMDYHFQSRPHNLLWSRLLRTDRFENQHHYPNIQPVHPHSVELVLVAHKRGLLRPLSHGMQLQGNQTKQGIGLNVCIGVQDSWWLGCRSCADSNLSVVVSSPAHNLQFSR